MPNDTARPIEPIDPRVVEAWDAQYRNPRASMEAASAVLEVAAPLGARTQAWAQLCIAYYRLRCETAQSAGAALDAAEALLAGVEDRRARLVLDNGRARRCVMQGNIDAGIRIFTDNLAVTDRSITALDRCQALNGIAGCYWDKGDWAQSLAYAFEALNLLREAGEHRHLAALLNNAGILLVTVGDFASAEQLLKEGIDIARGFEHPGLQQGLRAALIQCELDRGNAANALPLVDEIRAQGPIADGASLGAEVRHAIAETFIVNRRWDEARVELDRALATASQLAAPDLLAVNCFLRGLLAFRQADLAAAIATLEECIALLGAVTLPGVTCRAYRLLADAQAEAGDFQKAYANQRAFFVHHEARLGIASRAHYHALTLRHELERTRDVAQHDSLTGLFNRAFLDTALEAMAAQSRRTGDALCVAMLDLDHFKQINDLHGHLAGDEVLRQLAQLIRDNLRASDIACRYGGEEFCLILPATALADATAKLEALLARWSAMDIRVQGRALGPLGFSAGVAAHEPADASGAALLKRADLLLYRAKREGRGRVAT